MIMISLREALGPTWTVGFIKAFDINSLFARVRVLPLHFWGVVSALNVVQMTADALPSTSYGIHGFD